MEERARIPVGLPATNPIPSYWHTPKSPLANINHSPDKSQDPYDFIIVGSGISGTMIAWNLLKRGSHNKKILMLEAREVCGGATGRNGGHTKAASYRSYLQHVQELGKEEALRIVRMEWANIVETHRVAGRLGVECENEVCATVDVVYDGETFELGKRAICELRRDLKEEERRRGEVGWYEVHEDVGAVRERFCVGVENGNPAIVGGEKVKGAFEYMAGRVHAYRFSTGVLAECVKLGLQIRTNTPVLGYKPADNGLWEVCVADEKIATRAVVLATNGYTPFLERSLQGKIVPMRGQITAQRPGRGSTLPAPLPTTFSFIYKNGYEYMIPRPLPQGGQHIVIGGGLGRLPDAGAGEYGTVDDASLNPEISRYLHGSLSGSFDAASWGEVGEEESSERVVHEWTGIMGATADGRPFVGKVPSTDAVGAGDQKPRGGVWISAGFNGHGMVLCLKSAEALVTMIDNDRAGEPNDGSVSMKGLDWFPRSFVIDEDRLARCQFKGRMDLLQKHDSV
ncbi:hypothetical protein E8E13_002349 [Curvularia kusanoi]|uniref:FAD dependent oxidoreductase domain-containing protein n=1 Tax=Curvularia kusanoi TaxID=90978 RepID=A0A9P4T5J9_CURKU|nr:hypothetical protein E8E13_002349 [Curvularia kusanoi]